VLARIESLEQDHECADRNHAEIDRLGQLWLAHGELSAQDASRFQNLADQLERLYRHHIDVEDNEVFPFAARALTPEDRQAIGNEMAARRGIGWAGLSSPQGKSAEAR
jgi:hemerythrin-like domain-containing protein